MIFLDNIHLIINRCCVTSTDNTISFWLNSRYGPNNRL